MSIFSRIGSGVSAQGVALTAVLGLIAGFAIGQAVKTTPRVSFNIGKGSALKS